MEDPRKNAALHGGLRRRAQHLAAEEAARKKDEAAEKEAARKKEEAAEKEAARLKARIAAEQEAARQKVAAEQEAARLAAEQLASSNFMALAEQLELRWVAMKLGETMSLFEASFRAYGNRGRGRSALDSAASCYLRHFFG